MPVLDNPQHEAFAQLIAKGTNADKAYKKVYSNCKSGAKQAASRLLTTVDLVKNRVKELQEASASKTTLTMQERRERLARIVRIDLNNIDLSKDGDLVQEIIDTTSPEGAHYRKIKLPGKRECIMDDAKLAGELSDRVVHSGQIDHTITLSEDTRLAMIERRKAIREKIDAGKVIDITATSERQQG